jgi:hypothetical protein
MAKEISKYCCYLLAMISSLSIALSTMDRGSGLETRPRAEPLKWGDIIPNLPVIAGTLALQGGEEARMTSWNGSKSNRVQKVSYPVLRNMLLI